MCQFLLWSDHRWNISLIHLEISGQWKQSKQQEGQNDEDVGENKDRTRGSGGHNGNPA